MPRDQTESRGHTLPIKEGSLYWRHSAPTVSPSSPRPPLLFIHAAISDHTLWSPQVAHVNENGWHAIQYDLFGFGQSCPSESYLSQSCRSQVKHYEHSRQILNAFHEHYGDQHPMKCIVIGLSRGGCTALDFALKYPELIAGLIVCNGWVGGFSESSPPALQKKLFDAQESIMKSPGANASSELADLDVAIWGDGFDRDAASHPLDPLIRQKLHDWCFDIANRTLAGVGGNALPVSPDENLMNANDEVGNQNGSALNALKQGKLTAKTAIAVGSYDEAGTRECMFLLHEQAAETNIRLKEFATAHLVNLEAGSAFDAWLDQMLAWIVEDEALERAQAI